jgi:hypothetical protein
MDREVQYAGHTTYTFDRVLCECILSNEGEGDHRFEQSADHDDLRAPRKRELWRRRQIDEPPRGVIYLQLKVNLSQSL